MSLQGHGRRQGGGAREARAVPHPAEPPGATPTRRTSSSACGRRSRCGRCCSKRTSRTRSSRRSAGCCGRSACPTSSAPAPRTGARAEEAVAEVIAALEGGRERDPLAERPALPRRRRAARRAPAPPPTCWPPCRTSPSCSPAPAACGAACSAGPTASPSSCSAHPQRASALWLANLFFFAPRRRVTVTLEAFTPDRAARADPRGDQPLARRVVQRRHAARDADVRAAPLPVRPADRTSSRRRRRPAKFDLVEVKPETK